MKKRMMIKLSGKAIEDSCMAINIEYIQSFVDFVFQLHEYWDIAITIGGGLLARKFIDTARKIGLPDTRASLLGGDIGLTYARLIIAGLLAKHVPASKDPIEHWEEAVVILDEGRIPVLYGRWPALTSDSVASYFADYAEMDLVLKISCVDAIYDKDPCKYQDAIPYHYLSHDKMEELALNGDNRTSGQSFVLDLLAARRLKNSGIPMYLFHHNELEKTLKVIIEDNWQSISSGTLIGAIKYLGREERK